MASRVSQVDMLWRRRRSRPGMATDFVERIVALAKVGVNGRRLRGAWARMLLHKNNLNKTDRLKAWEAVVARRFRLDGDTNPAAIAFNKGLVPSLSTFSAAFSALETKKRDSVGGSSSLSASEVYDIMDVPLKDLLKASATGRFSRNKLVGIQLEHRLESLYTILELRKGASQLFGLPSSLSTSERAIVFSFITNTKGVSFDISKRLATTWYHRDLQTCYLRGLLKTAAYSIKHEEALSYFIRYLETSDEKDPKVRSSLYEELLEAYMSGFGSPQRSAPVDAELRTIESLIRRDTVLSAVSHSSPGFQNYNTKILLLLLRAYNSTGLLGKLSMERILSEIRLRSPPLNAEELCTVLNMLRNCRLGSSGQVAGLGSWLELNYHAVALKHRSVRVAALRAFASAATDPNCAIEDVQYDYAMRLFKARKPSQEENEAMVQLLFGTGQVKIGRQMLGSRGRSTSTFNSEMSFWLYHRRNFTRVTEVFAELQTSGNYPDGRSVDLLLRALLRVQHFNDITNLPEGMVKPAAAEAVANILALVRNYKGLQPWPQTVKGITQACQHANLPQEAKRLAVFKSLLNKS